MWCATCKKSRDDMADDGLCVSCSAFYDQNPPRLGILARVVAWARRWFGRAARPPV